MRAQESKFPFSMYAVSGGGRLVSARTNTKSMEIIEVTGGEVDIQIGTEVVSVAKGEFVYVPPTLVFAANATSEKASLRAIVFDNSILEANMENFDAEVFYMFFLQSRNKITAFNESHPVYKTLEKYMRESYEEYISKDVCYNLPIRANIYLMMTALLRYYCGSKDESDRMIYHNVLRLRPVIEYIDEHFTEKIYIEKLADMINVSPDYFTKMFRDTIGRTPVEYINGIKVNEAMRILTETDKAMADVADEIGFCNANYFHKIFKQYMNMCPLQYRKSAK